MTITTKRQQIDSTATAMESRGWLLLTSVYIRGNTYQLTFQCQ